MIKLFVFDYGRILFDREHNRFFNDAKDVLKVLSKMFRLAIVSYSKPEDVQNRVRALSESGLYKMFEELVFSNTPEGKDDAYVKLSKTTGVHFDEMAIVDDYIIRGVAWGNRNGSTTYWYQNGKFADVLPTQETGIPTYTITSLSEIPQSLEIR